MSICACHVKKNHIKANGKLDFRRLFNDTVDMEFEYALQLQSMKTICFRYTNHQIRLLVPFAIQKSIFISQDRLN